MKFLGLYAYYLPEKVASSHLFEDLNAAIEENKLNFTVITPVPTRGLDNRERKANSQKFNELTNAGFVEVKRFKFFKEGKNPILRSLRYLLMNIIEYDKAIREKNVDVVFSNSTPPTQGALSAIVAKKLSKKYKRKVPFVYNLQDVFPDSMINVGMTHEGSLLWKIGRKIESYTYKNADKIIVISEGFKRNIMAKGVPEEKIEVISNWIDLDSVQPIAKEDNTLYDEFGIDRDKFTVVYAGNFGAAQGADVVLKVAEKLKNYLDLQFVIFGGGAYFEDAKEQAASLSNVIIHSLLPQERVSEVYSLGDVALITCKPGTGNAGMPSKTWSIMACNTPIIASFDTDSDLADVLKTSGAGECVQPGDAEVLAEAILTLYSESLKETKKVYDSRKYVIYNASKDFCVNRYIEVIESVKENK